MPGVPAKGSAAQPIGTVSITPADPSKPVGYVKQKRREWREKMLAKNPDWVPPERAMNKAEIREAFASMMPDALTQALKILTNERSYDKDRIEVIKLIFDRVDGPVAQRIIHEDAAGALTDDELLAQLAEAAQVEGLIVDVDDSGNITGITRPPGEGESG